ncbi:MAG: hypothetical protein GY856_19160 [bacterium]|nr:hypothetical protein [bacterium]
MNLLVTFVRYELKLQARSMRFRWAAGFYVVFCCLPPVLLFALRETAAREMGPASYLSHLLQVQPFLTVLLAVLVAGQRSGTESLPETWPVLSAASIGNTGFLLRRWLAATVLLLPLTALPPLLTAALAAYADVGPVDPGIWYWSWTFEIAPRATIIAALWLGLVTILGNELIALVAGLIGSGILLHLLNQALFRWQLLVTSGDLLALDRFGRWISQAFAKPRWGQRFGFISNYATTEAPYDAATAFAELVPRIAPALGWAVAILALAVAFLHRTRRDLVPRRVRPDHPLRTYLALLNRLRERHAPSAALSRVDSLAAAFGLLALVGGLAVHVGYQIHYTRLADERYRVEIASDFPCQPAEIELTAWRLRGQIREDGSLTTEVRGSLRNHGSEPRDQLVFALNAALDLDRIEVTDRRVSTQRAWDRLVVTIAPPLEPGKTLDLRCHLSGAPTEIDFALKSLGQASFVTRFEGHRGARFLRDLNDLSQSWILRAISDRRVELRAMDLGPVPRLTPWTLTPFLGPGSGGREVPEERIRPKVDLTIDLSVPPRWFLADPCGHSSRRDGGNGPSRSRLRGECRIPVTDYGVFGAALQELDSSDAAVTFAALPAHREQAERRRESLATAARLSQRAWPGMKGVDGLVVIEWPPASTTDWSRPPLGLQWQHELRGQLLLLPERSFVNAEHWEQFYYAFTQGYWTSGAWTENLVADTLLRDLLARREVERRQENIFRSMYRSLMKRRMGLTKSGAAVSVRPGWETEFRKPILDARHGAGTTWNLRLPAVLADLEGRLGREALHAGIEAFLSRKSDRPGTIEELLATLEERTGVALDRFYSDYFTGDALPELRLEEVVAVRDPRGFTVTGNVRNTGTGEVICPVVVKAEIGEAGALVTVDSESATAFSVRTASRPHTVMLDPKRICHRLRQGHASMLFERVSLGHPQ